MPHPRRVIVRFAKWATTRYGCDIILYTHPLSVNLARNVKRATYLKTVVRPRTEHHVTILLVKRKVQNVYLAVRLIDGRGRPHDFAGVLEYRFRH